jgi:hypothetical protein
MDLLTPHSSIQAMVNEGRQPLWANPNDRFRISAVHRTRLLSLCWMSAFGQVFQECGGPLWVESEPQFHLPIQTMGTTASFFKPASSCSKE